MANSNVKVELDIGHKASIRTRRTPGGLTHDWEVFVQGADNSDISHFVDKIVFQLHFTYPNNNRVVEEPPYCVKEQGYAGFNMPITVYFKNSNEPKMVHFDYDLHLQTTGPPITKIVHRHYVFTNPPEEFKCRLIQGGGFFVDSRFNLTPPVRSPPFDGDAEE